MFESSGDGCNPPVIIRRFASSQQLITQPAHAALAERIMKEWQPGHFPDSPRKDSILNAIEQHDCGWSDIDETLVVDETTGRLLDFMEVSDALKRDTSSRGIERLSLRPVRGRSGGAAPAARLSPLRRPPGVERLFR